MLSPNRSACRRFFLGLVLAFSSVFHPAWADAQMPAGLRSAVLETLHEIRPVEADAAGSNGGSAYVTGNPGQNLSFGFDQEGVRVYPRRQDADEASWVFGMRLTGYGTPDDIRPVPAAELQAEGNRIEYRRGAITEWYLNDTCSDLQTSSAEPANILISSLD